METNALLVRAAIVTGDLMARTTDLTRNVSHAIRLHQITTRILRADAAVARARESVEELIREVDAA